MYFDVSYLYVLENISNFIDLLIFKRIVSLYLCLSVYLSVSLSVCLFVCLSLPLSLSNFVLIQSLTHFSVRIYCSYILKYVTINIHEI